MVEYGTMEQEKINHVERLLRKRDGLELRIELLKGIIAVTPRDNISMRVLQMINRLQSMTSYREDIMSPSYEMLEEAIIDVVNRSIALVEEDIKTVNKELESL